MASRRKRNTTIAAPQNLQLEERMQEREEFFSFAVDRFQAYGSLVEESQIQAVLPILCQVEFFKKSCPENMTIDEFVSNCIPRLVYEEFPRGKVIFHLGDQGDKFYIILSGRSGVLVPKDAAKIAHEEQEAEQLAKPKQKHQSTNNIQEEDYVEPFETILKRVIKKSSKTQQTKDIELALTEANRMSQYFTEGYACRYQNVFTQFAGISFGEMALTTDKPRTATIMALTHLKTVSLNKLGYKKVFERQIQMMNMKIDFFLRMYPSVTRFNMSKYVLYFKEFSLPQNAVLWKEGDPVSQGQVLVEKQVEPTNQLKDNLVAPNKKVPKINVVICTLGEGSIIGEDEVINHHTTRSYTCRTLVACKFYTINTDEFNICRRGYPEIVKVMQAQLQQNQKWQKQRIDQVLEVKQMEQLKGERKPSYVERRRVEDIEYQIPRFAEKFQKSNSTIRSNMHKKITKEDMVISNQDLFNQLQLTTDEKGIEKEFNMLKMANESVQKSLKIRVVKHYESLQPSKPKGLTPIFRHNEITPNSILEGLQSNMYRRTSFQQSDAFVKMFMVSHLDTRSNMSEINEGQIENKELYIKNQKLIKPYCTTTFFKKLAKPLLTELNESKSVIMPPIPIHSKTLTNSHTKLVRSVPKSKDQIKKFSSQPQLDKFILFSKGNHSMEPSTNIIK